MALFKPFQGKRETMPQELHDGYAYFCIDDGSFHIDYTDENGTLKRKQINAHEAEELIGFDIISVLNSSDTEIPTSKAVLTAITSHDSAADAHQDIRDSIPTVPEWAMAESKPTYTASEVGAAPEEHTHDQYLTDHQDISGKLDKSGGTMTGALVAQNNANYTTKQVRNIFLVADGETLPTGSNGDICLVYEA